MAMINSLGWQLAGAGHHLKTDLASAPGFMSVGVNSVSGLLTHKHSY
jgi:hypothetical protein